ncbi:uncharacterized protein LOC8274632 isoform X2 [Ricinus communis]|uniref:TLDc domain-containing protein n=1 Tax=Ricinus communis TaxID=3988 RepID=B9R862_RICCO|nr:uncharacterized protein LOC8274632 isoform X2 [Ricinus communis]EEF52692.1 conserved hypothetical protein [Ricinus communis]|eukprot:XP_002510505.1 uncharacterized protein LOC8274632 isoform X2 [Ricinus communis]
MGASSSTAQTVSNEQREVESLVASTGAMPMLLNTFSKLKDPQTNTVSLQSLQQYFYLNYKNTDCEAPSSIPISFPVLLDHLGASVVDLFYITEKKEGISWVEFLRGYLKCCGRMPASLALNLLLKVFSTTCAKAGLPLKLEFESIDDVDCKIGGSLLAADVVMLLWVCWTMLWDSKTSTSLKGKGNLCLPDVSHLVLSAVISCVEDVSGLNLWDCDISALDVQIPAGKFLSWALTTVPCLTGCFTQFVHARLQSSASLEDKSEPSTSSLGEISPREACNAYLLTLGRAWAISLNLRGTPSAEILKPYLPSDDIGAFENLLYRSSLNGRGLNRFWSNIEGYHGPLLLLVLATSGDAHEDSTGDRKWIIGALTQQGFENRDLFYGSSGSLYAICPVFHAFSPLGKDKNFVYSHLHPTSRVYEPHPKPVGIAFGGTIGNERIFIDEDFARITVRHHAGDKTYKHGSLFPSQGFLPVEASILEVEVWGLGGKTAKEVQTSYKRREELFIEQRRKVDLKTFASWEDSPEKMMMDMMSDPNVVRREDR